MENQIHNYFFLSRNRFVNSYNLYVWKNGQQKDQGQKITITNCATSTDLLIEPCVSYNFPVEFIEHDWAKTDIKSTKFFRYYIYQEATPSLLNTNISNFKFRMAIIQTINLES